MKLFFLTIVAVLVIKFTKAQIDTSKLACYSTIFNLLEKDSISKANSELDKCISELENDYFFSYLKGLWFLKQNKFDSAQKSLTNSIEKRGGSKELSFVYLTLADVYIGSKEYKKALLILDSTNSYSELHNRFYKRRDIDYRQAQCYVGLNKIDTALHILTPYIFSSSNSREGKKTKEVILYYKELLLTKYKLKRIKKELRSSIKRIFIENTFLSKKTSSSDTTYWLEWNHKSYTYFLNTKINLKRVDNVFLNQANINIECPIEFKRKAIVRIIKESFFYNLIFKRNR